MEHDATKLEHLRRLQKVLLFIEKNLDEELNLEQLAKVGCFSMYHFHRIFHGAIGETSGAYVPDITAEGHIRSEACCTAPPSIPEEGEVVRKVVEGGRYATFEHRGPLNVLGKTFDGIFGNWYPSSGEQLAERSCLIELSELPLKGNSKDSKAKVHIPLE